MRAAVLVAPRRIEIEDRPDPVCGPREVVIRVACAGVCGTDLALFSGEYGTDLPLVLGHEFCGTVEEVGAEADAGLAGKFVTADINLTCRTRKDPAPCPACSRSLPSHCLRRTTLGIRGADGAFAEEVAVPAAQVHRLPDGLSPWAGAMVEPLAAAIRTFQVTPLAPEDTVVVLGAGRLGLLVCRAARSYGARVLAVSRSEAGKALALRFGADEALDADGAPEAVRKATGGLGADVVAECTGSPDGFSAALELVRPRGTVALKTTCAAPPRDLDATDIVVREITVQGTRCGPFDKAIRRLETGKVPVEDLVSGVYPLADTAAALEAASRSTKILIEP